MTVHNTSYQGPLSSYLSTEICSSFNFPPVLLLNIRWPINGARPPSIRSLIFSFLSRIIFLFFCRIFSVTCTYVYQCCLCLQLATFSLQFIHNHYIPLTHSLRTMVLAVVLVVRSNYWRVLRMNILVVYDIKSHFYSYKDKIIISSGNSFLHTYHSRFIPEGVEETSQKCFKMSSFYQKH
jgi:hypothetical protein